MNKIILLLILFLCQGCSNIELTNVSYEDINFASSSVKNKTPISVEKNTYCLLAFCNNYDYGRFAFPLKENEFIYDVINENQDKGNAITDIDINIEIQNFIFYLHKKITLTGNMFYDTSSQP